MASDSVCEHCKNVYQDPRILSCLHSYCLQCINKIHVQGTTSITCPSCNHPTPLPEGGVASLPPNIRLKEEAEQVKILQQLVSTPLPLCESCEDDNSVSVAYCKDCDKVLCQDCWKVHKKAIMSRSHSTYDIDDLKKKSRSDLLKILPSSTPFVPLCPDHDNEMLDFYCTQCAVPVCDKCSTGRHKGHPVEEVSQQVLQNKKQILHAIAGLPEQIVQLDNVITTIERTEGELEDCKNKAYNNIQELFMKLRQLIDQREKELLFECKQLATSRQEHLSIQKKGLQHLSESMSQCHSLASNATSQYTDVQLLSIAQTLQDRADTLQQQFTGTSLDLCEIPDISVEANTDTLAQMISEFGGVAVTYPSSSKTTAVVPRQRSCIVANQKIEVKVTTRDGSGKELNKGGSVVRGILTCSGQGRVECPVNDNGDGTYLVSVIPQQLGQHQLSITVNSQGIQGSPFNLSVVAQRDYTKLKDPVQTITNTCYPNFIAFNDDGDMFVTSSEGKCIHVYDSSGKKKTTIGSWGNGQPQFKSPCGIDINGDVVYVVDTEEHRIYRLTTGGKLLSTFGDKLSKKREFNAPYDLKISPNGKVYVAETGNHRIQVFNPDLTFSHVIIFDAKESGCGSSFGPEGIAFDLSGNVHVGCYNSSSVKVFTSSGQFIHQYGKTHSPSGIAIDPSGYSLVNNWDNGTLSIFDPTGRFINSVGGFSRQYGVSVSPDGSVWVADTYNHRLVKF